MKLSTSGTALIVRGQGGLTQVMLSRGGLAGSAASDSDSDSEDNDGSDCEEQDTWV